MTFFSQFWSDAISGSMDVANLPIVDLDDPNDPATLRRGLFETGFFHLRDPTLPPELLVRMRAETQAFFRESESRKMEFRGTRRGYAVLREEHTAAARTPKRSDAKTFATLMDPSPSTGCRIAL